MEGQQNLNSAGLLGVLTREVERMLTSVGNTWGNAIDDGACFSG
jgi:hypothetical protein